jgi:hypothetical protein
LNRVHKYLMNKEPLSNNFFGGKGVFLYTGKKLKMTVKSLNYCQTIVRQKRRISTCYLTGNLSKILLPQSISLQKCIQTADILSLLLLHKYLLPKFKKKSQKAWKLPAHSELKLRNY